MTENIRVLFVGPDRVGKSALIQTLETDSFPGRYIYHHGDSHGKSVLYNNKWIALSFREMPSAEDYERLRPFYWDETDVILFMYAISNPNTLEKLATTWIPEANQRVPDIPIILVGNMLEYREILQTEDKDKKQVHPDFVNIAQMPEECITRAQGEAAAAEMGALSFLEVSAAQLYNLQPILTAMIEAIFPPPRRNRNKCILL